MIRFKIFFLFFLFLFSAIACGSVVLIDPGHGGEDDGAKTGHKSYKIKEKDLVLDFSKLIVDELKKKHSVFLTRSLDRSVGLSERANIADKINADLFISIHLNSSKSKISNGFEIYYLDNHDNLAVKKVEDTENRSFLSQDPTLDKILLDLIISKTVSKSKKLAASIHKTIKKDILKKYSIRDRGIRPGLFFVLAMAKRPAVLIEIGFLSNKKELKILSEKSFQKQFAKTLSLGIDDYLKQYKNGEMLPLF